MGRTIIKLPDSFSNRTVMADRLMALAVLCVVVVNCLPTARSYNMVTHAIQAPGLPPELDVHLKNLFQDEAATGNVWIRFEGPVAGDAGFMSKIYFFGNYVLYPRRIYVALPTVVINGDDLPQRQGSFAASDARALGVEWLITFRSDETGRVFTGVERL